MDPINALNGGILNVISDSITNVTQNCKSDMGASQIIDITTDAPSPERLAKQEVLINECILIK